MVRLDGNYNLGGVFGLLAFIFGLGFIWFFFLSPESVGAAEKATQCLVGLFVGIAGNLWFALKDEKKEHAETQKWNEERTLQESLNNRQVAEHNYFNDRINRLEEKILNCKKQVCQGDDSDCC